MNRDAITIVLLCCSGLFQFGRALGQEEYDVVIRNGRLVDGTGSPWFQADIAIKDGTIAKIGRVPPESGSREIDARGLIVAPGFIDMMGQSATPMMHSNDAAMNLLTQGITTINAGEGGSAAPLDEHEAAREGYSTMAEYFALLESKGIPINVAQTVGHTQIRRIVLGDTDRRPSDQELEQMQAMVDEAMEAGAIGVSTALIYPPAVYARMPEIAALVEAASAHGGRYYTHMRNEGDKLLEAVDEALEIGKLANSPVHIFHLKAAGRQNWGKMQLAVARIKAARSAGQEVTADIYPYINNGLGIAALIHPRHFANGSGKLLERLDDPELRKEIRAEMEGTEGWENWFRHAGHDWSRIVIGRSNHSGYRDWDGQSVAEMAKAKGEDPWDTFFNLVKSGAFALPETMTDANKILAMRQPFVSFCTDVGPYGESRSASHPRAFGSFPRLLSKYVRDLGAIPLERAVAQASANAANCIMAYDRGRLAVGLAADIVVFDFQTMEDRADFRTPDALSLGIKHVLVNGQVVLDEGKFTGELPGKILRGPGYQEQLAPYNTATGPRDERFANYDIEIRRFMQQHRVAGLSIAVTDKSKIVFSRGYGYADIARRAPVDSQSLFRIASISKPITAVAILRLAEQGKLELQSTVSEVLDLEPLISEAGESFDSRWHDITIQHLLQHRGGWDRDQSFDAMFQSVRFARQAGTEPPADQWAVIEAMLAQPLDFAPGERYAYSNFGYCLLGRIVEQVTGQSYERYVQQHVLRPLGIEGMRLGATRLSERAENEVRYYQPGTGKSVFQADLDQQVPWPYGAWNLEAMDAHGGWIASAEDLAKFAVAFDDPDQCPILDGKSVRLMHERPEGLGGYEENGDEKQSYYSLGWMNRVTSSGINHWHTGSLAGTATILIRRHDGKNFVALMNTRISPTTSHLGREIDRLLHLMANGVAEWPE